MRKEETHKQDDSIWDSVRELGALPPEIDDEGNVEYKACWRWSYQRVSETANTLSLQLKLVDPSLDRLEHLITQLKWRYVQSDYLIKANRIT